MAVAGDEIFVGRPGAAARPGSPAGGLHVFQHDAAGGWAERAVLAPTDLVDGDDFGAAIAVHGRVLAVGAPGVGEQRGAVYLFARTAKGRWMQHAKLVAAAGAPGDRLGSALALQDGVLLVGAPSHAADRGRVVVFRRRAGNVWTEAGILASGDTSHMSFGQTLELADGYAYVSAAGPVADPLAVLRLGSSLSPLPKADALPRVFVFRDSAGTFVGETQLESTDSDANSASGFGSTLVANGSDLLVSSPQAHGAVSFFRRTPTGEWVQRQRLAADGAGEVTGFGAAMVRAGHELLIGAPFTKTNTGTIFVFHYDSIAGRWIQAQQLILPQGTVPFPRYAATGPLFGARLTADGGLAIAGMPSVDNAEGAAAVLHRDPSGRWQQIGHLIDSAWNTRQPRVGHPAPCHGGRALVFDCRNVDLVAFLPLTAIGGGRDSIAENMVSGVWGWTDSITGREFALVGRSDGTAFVEVTDPVHPKYLGELPLHAGARPSLWRDMKVYKNHAFVISDEAGAHGMQVFDLTQLRAVGGTPIRFRETAYYDRFASAHTLAIDAETGFLYAAGANAGGETCGGGLHVIDARTPAAPVFAGCFADSLKVGDQSSSYVHETTCARYHGPDAHYHGRELCFNAAVGALVIADVTDKAKPKTVSMATYPNVRFAHQGWLSDDQRYFFLDDEFDESAMRGRLGLAQTRTRTIVFDLTELDDPVVATEFFGMTAATDHNLYMRGSYMYQSNYKAGLRVIDVAEPRNPQEVGYFDTAPAFDNVPGFAGAWTNYPYFKSGIVAVTSIGEGLFLVRFRRGVERTGATMGRAH